MAGETTGPGVRGLIDRLAASRSPLERAKAIGALWSRLRDLRPSTRRSLALRLGLERVTPVLESLGARRGLSPESVRDLVGALKSPRRVRRLADDLRDPRRRGDLVAQGLGELLALAGEAEEEAAPPAVEAPAAKRLEAGQPAAETPEALTSEADRPATATPAVAAPDPRRASPAPAAPPVPAVAGPSPATAIPAAVSRPAATDPPGDRGASRRGLVGRLLRLRAEAGGLAGGPVEELVDRVTRFPDGWARRRAVSALVEGPLPDGAAARLIDCLGSPADRRWCARLAADGQRLAGRRRDELLRRFDAGRRGRRRAATA